MSPPCQILIAGVGGQGVLTLAELIGEAALGAGHEVTVGQLHGMSQRGGSVQATVRIDAGEDSFIEDGGADLVVGLEPLETLRARPKMSRRTRVLVNLGPIVPHTLAQTGQPYPPLAGVLAGIRAVAGEVIEVDGPGLAASAGSARAVNLILLGALSRRRLLPFAPDDLFRALDRHGDDGRRELNRRAFQLGQEAA